MAYEPPSIVAISIVLPALSILAVCLRFLVRLRLKPTFIGIDDWLILAAVIFLVADGANLAAAAVLGLVGREYPGQIPPERYTYEKKSDWAQIIIEKPLYGMIKLSVLFFYRRIFFVERRFIAYNNAVIAFIVAWFLAFMLADMFDCGLYPAEQWDPQSDAGHCVNMTSLYLVFGVTDVVGDILVVVSPYPCVRKLRISTREKAGVVLIFMLGTLSTTAATIRLYFIAVACAEDYSAAGIRHGAATPPGVWSTIEGAIGVLAACLPPLGPLIKRPPKPRSFFLGLRRRLTAAPGSMNASGAPQHPTFNGEDGETRTDELELGQKRSKETSASFV